MKRRRVSKPRRGRGRAWKKPKISDKALKAAVEVLATSTVESKFLDTELAATALTTSWVSLNPTGTGATDTLSVPAEGTGESDRDGRVYTIQSIMVRGVITTSIIESGAAPVADFRARVILYWDRQTNSAEATATDIMDAGGTDDTLAFRNLHNTHRFIVLFDETMLIQFDNQLNEGAANLFAVGQREFPFNFYKRFSKKDIRVQCDATAANITSCSDNNFGIAAIVSSTGVASTIKYQARCRFRG